MRSCPLSGNASRCGVHAPAIEWPVCPAQVPRDLCRILEGVRPEDLFLATACPCYCHYHDGALRFTCTKWMDIVGAIASRQTAVSIRMVHLQRFLATKNAASRTPAALQAWLLAVTRVRVFSNFSRYMHKIFILGLEICIGHNSDCQRKGGVFTPIGICLRYCHPRADSDALCPASIFLETSQSIFLSQGTWHVAVPSSGHAISCFRGLYNG